MRARPVQNVDSKAHAGWNGVYRGSCAGYGKDPEAVTPADTTSKSHRSDNHQENGGRSKRGKDGRGRGGAGVVSASTVIWPLTTETHPFLNSHLATDNRNASLPRRSAVPDPNRVATDTSDDFEPFLLYLS